MQWPRTWSCCLSSMIINSARQLHVCCMQHQLVILNFSLLYTEQIMWFSVHCCRISKVVPSSARNFKLLTNLFAWVNDCVHSVECSGCNNGNDRWFDLHSVGQRREFSPFSSGAHVACWLCKDNKTHSLPIIPLVKHSQFCDNLSSIIPRRRLQHLRSSDAENLIDYMQVTNTISIKRLTSIFSRRSRVLEHVTN